MGGVIDVDEGVKEELLLSVEKGGELVPVPRGMEVADSVPVAAIEVVSIGAETVSADVVSIGSEVATVVVVPVTGRAVDVVTGKEVGVDMEL